MQSTAKITRAQELIAASRIIKAQQRAHEAEPYAREITAAVEAVVSRSGQIDHPLTREPSDPKRAAVLVLTSDRGFAGGFNANVLREVAGPAPAAGRAARRAGAVRQRAQGHHLAPVPRDRDGGGVERLLRHPGRSRTPGRSPTALLDAYNQPTEEGGVDEIHIVYTDFVSMLTQEPVVRRLLPLEIEETTEPPDSGPLPVYDFEPSPEAVLDALLPWYVESRIFYALLDSAASEIASRRRAMKSATDNANDLIEQLSREANKARQSEITQEISEIVGGANALAETISGSK